MENDVVQAFGNIFGTPSPNGLWDKQSVMNTLEPDRKVQNLLPNSFDLLT